MPKGDIAAEIEALDDDLNPVGGAEAEVDTSEDTKDETSDEAEDTKADDAEDEDNEGYTADEDDGEGESTDKTPEKVEAPQPQGELSPEMQYIVDGLADITVFGRENRDSPVKQFVVKTASQLPEGFEFVNKRSELIFNEAIAEQTQRAVSLQNQYQQKVQQDKAAADAQDYNTREARGIRADVADLQREGEMPKFKVPVDNPKFNEDPAAKTMQDVLDLMGKRNEQYLKEYEAGRPYRHIGFKEAYYEFRRANPEKPAETAQEDKERKAKSRQVGGNRGPVSESGTRGVPQGTTTKDIMRQLDGMDW